jgi:hypothetical protein
MAMSNDHPSKLTKGAFIASIIDAQDANGSTIPRLLEGDAAAAALTVLASVWYDWMRDTPADPSQLGRVFDDMEEVVAILRRTEKAVRAHYGVPARFENESATPYQLVAYLVAKGFEQPHPQPVGPYVVLRKGHHAHAEVIVPLTPVSEQFTRLLADLEEREILPFGDLEHFTRTYEALFPMQALIERGLKATGTQATISFIENGGEAEIKILVHYPAGTVKTMEYRRPIEVYISVIDDEFRAVETIKNFVGEAVDYHEIAIDPAELVIPPVLAHIHGLLVREALA